MKINSRVFGDIEVDDEKIITFEEGMPGFEQYHKYAITYDSEKEQKRGVMWLISVEEPSLAFPILDPTIIAEDYNPIVEDEWLAALGAYEKESDLFVLLVMTVPQDITQMTVNMKAPIIINTLTKKACQIIVNNDDYEVRYHVYEYLQKMKEESLC